MNDVSSLVVASVAGLLLGTVFYGGLWVTVRRGVTSGQPALWFFGSLLLRLGIALGGFYVVAGGHWHRLLACLMGFVMARLVVTWLIRPSGEKHTRPARAASHAPQSR